MSKRKYPKYGDKRDYPKIDIFVGGKYVASTTWARTQKEAKEVYLRENPNVQPETVSTARGARP